jgi:predicted CXXCH cytochrome family protein
LTKSVALYEPAKAKTDPRIAEFMKSQADFMSQHFWPDGIVRISGRDYSGMIESACYKRGDLSCLSCHSMHHSSPANQLSVGMEGNQACLQCHAPIKEKLVQHTHHSANSSGSLCYNCHMPYTNYGLLKAIRSHTIDSPNVATTLKSGRPNACNLCHLDKSLEWTDDKLAQWFSRPRTTLKEQQRQTAASVLWSLSGDAGQRALVAWAMGWEPAREASGETWLAPYLAQQLVDPYSAVRYIAGHSLQRLKGFEDFKFDFIGAPADLERARSAALKTWLQGMGPERRGPETLMTSDGKLQEDKFKLLLQQRDNHSMELKE